MLSDLKRIGLEACVLVTFGALFGLTLNYQLVIDAFSGRLAPQQRLVTQERLPTAMPMPVLIDDVRQALANGGLIVDARSPELYTVGHIDGALSLPMVEIDTVLPAFLADVPKDQHIIAYCSGFGCPDSFDLGVRLIESGYTDVHVFEGGFPEWRDAGLPVAGEGR